MHESVRIGGELWLIFHKLESKMFNNWEVVLKFSFLNVLKVIAC